MKRTKWRQRLHSTCKWGGVTLCVLLFALWLSSRWWLWVTAHWTSGPPSGVDQISVVNGLIMVFRDSAVLPTSELHGWDFSVQSASTMDHSWGWSWRVVKTGTISIISIPLWLPFLLIALPTGYLFWSDHRRRMRVGCCEKCGYDLTGNTTGRCPECGEALADQLSRL